MRGRYRSTGTSLITTHCVISHYLLGASILPAEYEWDHCVEASDFDRLDHKGFVLLFNSAAEPKIVCLSRTGFSF
jgi:hypothetical protein